MTLNLWYMIVSEQSSSHVLYLSLTFQDTLPAVESGMRTNIQAVVAMCRLQRISSHLPPVLSGRAIILRPKTSNHTIIHLPRIVAICKTTYD